MPSLTPEETDNISRELLVRVTQHYRDDATVMDVQSVTVHPGPKAWKTVSLVTIGDASTGEIRSREFRAQTWSAKSLSEGGGYDFEKATNRWHCEGDEEIEGIRMLLNNEFTEAGKYKIIPAGTDAAALVDQLSQGQLSGSDAVALIELAGSQPDLVAALASSPRGVLVAEAVELERRRQQLEELRRVVEDPSSSERDDIHPLVKQMTWIFGGDYLGENRRKSLTVGDVLDVPLLRPDGALHIVELKGANIPKLIEQYRGAKDRAVVTGEIENVPLVVGVEANRAVGQVMGYLTHLDESRDTIYAKFKVDARRASATVLIGHPDFVDGYSREEVDETIRVFNSHHARIQLRHYAELIEGAERALALTHNDDLDEQSAAAEAWGPPDPSSWADEPPF
ncbi:hypothetical protein [Aeromicrobium sp. HA]|uniref:hypothetical protein n=1 Tax=Aeromicrobium sp. HA TaxID=3009077 RepID=UPI0022AFB919|nr:hypothetical protein [Aeromicrobium sp. HA]